MQSVQILDRDPGNRKLAVGSRATIIALVVESRFEKFLFDAVDRALKQITCMIINTVSGASSRITESMLTL